MAARGGGQLVARRPGLSEVAGRRHTPDGWGRPRLRARRPTREPAQQHGEAGSSSPRPFGACRIRRRLAAACRIRSLAVAKDPGRTWTSEAPLRAGLIEPHIGKVLSKRPMIQSEVQAMKEKRKLKFGGAEFELRAQNAYIGAAVGLVFGIRTKVERQLSFDLKRCKLI